MPERLIAAGVNSEEPSDEAMDRLWAALDATLDPDDAAPLPAARPDRDGTHLCLRCGWRWTPHPDNATPRSCAHCRSAYWNTPPVKPYARRPERTDWAAEQAKMADAAAVRRRYRHLAKVKELARELGLDITDPRTGDVVRRTRRGARVLERPLEPIDLSGALAESNDPAASKPIWTPPMRRGSVPPPPGLEDLEPKGTS
jgi:hypothetical protein